mmetsp:Transcript_26115/g.84046  ORF Transcript_26115/g.84046 Transcript_26115/m.84046 type:complete len:325 (+) Transcript_26115:227-1201(+)
MRGHHPVRGPARVPGQHEGAVGAAAAADALLRGGHQEHAGGYWGGPEQAALRAWHRVPAVGEVHAGRVPPVFLGDGARCEEGGRGGGQAGGAPAAQRPAVPRSAGAGRGVPGGGCSVRRRRSAQDLHVRREVPSPAWLQEARPPDEPHGAGAHWSEDELFGGRLQDRYPGLRQGGDQEAAEGVLRGGCGGGQRRAVLLPERHLSHPQRRRRRAQAVCGGARRGARRQRRLQRVRAPGGGLRGQAPVPARPQGGSGAIHQRAAGADQGQVRKRRAATADGDSLPGRGPWRHGCGGRRQGRGQGRSACLLPPGRARGSDLGGHRRP